MQKSGQGSAHLSAFAGPKHVQRHCTDVVCFMLFVIVWIAAIVVGFFGYSTGDPDRITHGYDFQGNACGVGSNSQFPFVYFPVPGLVHYSVCVQACPVSFNTATCAKTVQQSDTKGDIITCNQGPLPSGPQLVKCLRTFTNIALYGGSLASAGFCFLTYPTNDFFNRCLPLANATSVTLGSPPVPSVVLTDFNKVSTSAQLTFQFQSGEVVNGKYLIVACIALSMGFAIVYSFFLRFSTALVVWATIILSFFLLLGTGSLLLFKAGMLNSAFLTKEFPDYPTSSSVSYTSDQKKALEVHAAITFAICFMALSPSLTAQPFSV
jgi:choline transporter-like protein 2/4/5